MSDDIFDFDIDAELAKAEEKAAQKVKRSLSSSKTKRTAKVARSDRLTHKKTAAAVFFISERRAVSIQHESPDEERRHQNQAKCGHRHQYFPQNVFFLFPLLHVEIIQLKVYGPNRRC